MRLSITICWPSRSASRWLTVRAVTSENEPAWNGTIRRIGRSLGQRLSCASVGTSAIAITVASATTSVPRRLPVYRSRSHSLNWRCALPSGRPAAGGFKGFMSLSDDLSIRYRPYCIVALQFCQTIGRHKVWRPRPALDGPVGSERLQLPLPNPSQQCDADVRAAETLIFTIRDGSLCGKSHVVLQPDDVRDLASEFVNCALPAENELSQLHR